MNNATSDKLSDSEAKEIVERFERIYASLATPDDVDAAPAPTTPRFFGEDDFELPGSREEPRGVDGTAERMDAVRREPVLNRSRKEPEAVVEPDIDEAFAILRGSEIKAQAPAEARRADPDADAEAEDKTQPKREPRAPAMQASKSYRRFAVPALAATVFISLATGYVVTRHYEAPGATASANAIPATPLRLDYQLQQTRGENVVARRPR